MAQYETKLALATYLQIIELEKYTSDEKLAMLEKLIKEGLGKQ